MSVHDIPRSRWADVLEQFSRGHRGWLASVVTVRPGPELTSHTDWRPLESVTVTRTAGRPTAIRVTFQGGPTVRVRAPRTLGVDRRDDGAERALEIDAAEGEFVRIVFRATALPEEVDGIAPAELVEPHERVAAIERQGRSANKSSVRIEERHVSE
jgi:hypothetical protein